MKFDCRDLEHALASGDAALMAAARSHAASCAVCRSELDLDDELTAAARTLHREWDSPNLWAETARRMQASDRTLLGWLAAWPPLVSGVWPRVAAAAAVIALVASVTWFGWRSLGPDAPPAEQAAAQDRLLSEEALAAIEKSEQQYANAIDELTRVTAPKLEMPDSPLLVNLRERLIAIDAAIAECRAEIGRNRFNAHLRRQLLWIYQEKRRTLEQIQEYDPNAL